MVEPGQESMRELLSSERGAGGADGKGGLCRFAARV